MRKGIVWEKVEGKRKKILQMFWLKKILYLVN